MPIYAYKCSACGHAEDVLQKISDAPAGGLSRLRPEHVFQAGDGRRLPAQGLGLVRHRFSQQQRSGQAGRWPIRRAGRQRRRRRRCVRLGRHARTRGAGSHLHLIAAQRHARVQEVLHHRLVDLGPPGHHGMGAGPARRDAGGVRSRLLVIAVVVWRGYPPVPLRPRHHRGAADGRVCRQPARAQPARALGAHPGAHSAGARSTTRSSRSAIPCWRPMAGRFARPC
ncbi:putative regulatory protein, FmdB family [Bordetella pertussis]|nr:putative regulatory protein, FmdB family [Bordetella pertussis]